MGCSLFSNYHFQMGVTVMGFAEDFGLNLLTLIPPRGGEISPPPTKIESYSFKDVSIFFNF